MTSATKRRLALFINGLVYYPNVLAGRGAVRMWKGTRGKSNWEIAYLAIVEGIPVSVTLGPGGCPVVDSLAYGKYRLFDRRNIKDGGYRFGVRRTSRGRAARAK